MATTNSVTLTLGYDGTDFTRKLKFDNVDASALSGISSKVQAINASLSAGTDGGLSSFFLADDGSFFSGITAASSDQTTTDEFDLNGGE